MSEKKRIQITETHLTIDGDDYSIALNKINTPKKLINWICDFCDNPWVDTSLLKNVLIAVSKEEIFQ